MMERKVHWEMSAPQDPLALLENPLAMMQPPCQCWWVKEDLKDLILCRMMRVVEYSPLSSVKRS